MRQDPQVSPLQEESSWIQLISYMIARNEAAIFITEKTSVKPSPLLRVYPIMKFIVATPWVRSIQAFSMPTALEWLHKGRWSLCALSLFRVPTRNIHKLRIKLSVSYVFTTLKIFIQYIQKPAIVSLYLLFAKDQQKQRFNKDFPGERKSVKIARNCKNIFWFPC